MCAQFQPDQTPSAHFSSGLENRHRPLRILFIHSRAPQVQRCLQELTILERIISSEIIVTPAQFTERLRSNTYDLIVAEHPSRYWGRTEQLDILRRSQQSIPLIFIGDALDRETVAEFITKGAFDGIEMDQIGHLSVSVRRAIDEQTLRDERDRAEKMLRHSEAKYRALVGNLTYGLCRCNTEGKFLDVNQALVTMLGYASEEELLAEDLASDIICDPAKRALLLGQSPQEDRGNDLGPREAFEPFEVDWKRKDGATLKVRLTGRAVTREEGETEGYEIIVEDVTKQRELEHHLRQQATHDSLTGLANYRHLVDVLDSEIKRSMRTRREFAVLLFDLDGLKQINDRHGHMVGSVALCRLADILCLCSRSIDTASRFGGDEFALVLPETDARQARVVASHICKSFAEDRREPPLTVSIGIAVYPKDAQTIETLLAVADRAMYAMKSGRTNAKVTAAHT